MRNVVYWTIAISILTAPAFSDNGIPWDPAFNRYFGVELTDPTYAEMRDALAARLNRRTLDNIHPQDEHSTFKTFLKETNGADGKKLKSKVVARLYDNMTDYLELEHDFDDKFFKNAVDEAAEIVKYQSYTAPDWNYDYPDTLVSVMNKRKMLVPSTVLFDVYLNPYRPTAWPRNARLVEADAVPRVQRSTYTMQVYVQLPADSGPLARIDFETVELGGLVIEASWNGTDFRGVMHVTSTEPRGVLAPVIIDAPVKAPYIRLTATSPTNTAMLRDLKLYTLDGLQ